MVWTFVLDKGAQGMRQNQCRQSSYPNINLRSAVVSKANANLNHANVHAQDLPRVVREAEALLIAAGAGMGVDSGLPDFHGPEGFWGAYPEAKRLGLSFEELANPRWFEESPRLAWAFYGHRLGLYRATQPHRGFGSLRQWSKRLRHGAFVFTSNVDGQFQKAGFPAHRIVECHGSIHHAQCSEPCGPDITDASSWQVAVDAATFQAHEPLPRCPRCDRVMRPNILMFEDAAWIPDRTDAQMQGLRTWLGLVAAYGARLLVLEIGAGQAVPSVRAFTESMVRDHHADLVRINPAKEDPSPGVLTLRLSGLQGIEQLTALLQEA